MPLTAFLVEDNPTIRSNLIPALADLADVRVEGWAEGERDALAWLDAHPGEARLLILDLFLAEGSGLGVLAECGRHGWAGPVVMLTNYATPDVRARCLQLGAGAVFDKSSELETFFEYCCTVAAEQVRHQ